MTTTEIIELFYDEMLDEIIKSPLNDADKEYLKDSLSEVRKTVTETYQSSK